MGKVLITGSSRKRATPTATGWKWFALRVEPGAEFAVQRRLDRDHAINDTFLPLVHSAKRTPKRKQLQARPRIPGYLFIGFSMNHIPWGFILTIKGVIDVLRQGDEPFSFSAMEMHRLVLAAQRPRHTRGGAARVRSRSKKQDDVAQITSGPYAGHVVRMVDDVLYAFSMRNYTLSCEHGVITVKGVGNG